MLKRTKLSAALLLAFSGTAAMAQSTTDTMSPKELERVTVTGSNIRRADAETPSPVQVLSAQDLRQSGYTTVSEVLQNITANGQGTLSNAFPGAFAGSATGISLRGLNTSSTLVLIDGHRMAPFPLSDDNQRSFVDISSIPFEAVERIEILKDGASAAYGSDAMAGVVNIILKKRFNGTSVTADLGKATEGGGTAGHVAITHGFGDLDADGYNAYASLEYRHSNEITQQQRQGKGAWSNLDQTAIGGVNQTPGVIRPTVAAPPAYGTVYLQPSTFTAANTIFYSKPIQSNPSYSGACTFALLSSGGCAFTNPFAEIQPKTENINFIASFSKKLGADWLFDLKASVFESKGEQYNAGSTANGLVVYPTSFNPLVAVSAGSPARLVGTPIASVTVPGTYPGNTSGLAARIRGVNLDAPIAHDTFDNKSYRLVGNLTGSLYGWDLDGSAGFTRVSTDRSIYGATYTPALYAALNRAANPWLITGGNTAADIAAVFPTASAVDTSTLSFAEANATRSLVALSGGNLGVSVGTQYIHRAVDAPAPDNIAQGLLSGNNAYVKGSQSDTSLYAEISAPVLKSLELDGHIRFDHFDSIGNATTPQVGFKWAPLDQLTFRGTAGKGFRAPNPAESGQAGNSYSAGTIKDPILCADGKTTTAGNVVSTCNFNANYLNNSNPGLEAEKSTSYTLGLILEPIKGWSTTFDLYQVKISNQIVTQTSSVDSAVRGSPITSDCATGVGNATAPCTTSVGTIIYIPSTYINANSTKVNGWELDSRYRFKLGEFGNISTELDWSHTMSYVLEQGGVKYQLAGTHGPILIGGNTGNPKDRIQAKVSYDKGPFLVTTTLNWISDIDLTDPSGGNLTCADGANNGGYYSAWVSGGGEPTDSSACRVHSFFTADVAASYKFSSNLTLRASVNNVLNRQPPLDINTYGGGNLPYNPSLHQAGAVGRFINVGATYTF